MRLSTPTEYRPPVLASVPDVALPAVLGFTKILDGNGVRAVARLQRRIVSFHLSLLDLFAAGQVTRPAAHPIEELLETIFTGTL